MLGQSASTSFIRFTNHPERKKSNMIMYPVKRHHSFYHSKTKIAFKSFNSPSRPTTSSKRSHFLRSGTSHSDPAAQSLPFPPHTPHVTIVTADNDAHETDSVEPITDLPSNQLQSIHLSESNDEPIKYELAGLRRDLFGSMISINEDP